MNLPLCKCGCGAEVSKPQNKYINGHYKKRYRKAWNKGIPFNDETKKRMSNSAIEKFKNKPDLLKKCGWKKFTYERLVTYYDFLLKEEVCKKYNNSFQFKCKFCDRWFTPTTTQIQERIRAIKNSIGLIHNYFYCNKTCKQSCRLYNRHSDPDIYDKLQEYRMKVYRQTSISISKFKNKIKNIELRSKEYELDHKYSIYEGFKNNIDPKIIGHYKNLEILSKIKNRKKGTNCSITLKELKIKIGEL